MKNIINDLLATENYITNCNENYKEILETAEDILSKTNDKLIWINIQHDNLKVQINKLYVLQENIDNKIENNEYQIEEIKQKIRDIEDQIYEEYSKERDSSDSDDDSKSSSIIHQLENAKQMFQIEKERLEEKGDSMESIKREIILELEYCLKLESAISSSEDFTKNSIFEQKKYISALNDETNYNLSFLNAKKEDLDSYLQCETIEIK